MIKAFWTAKQNTRIFRGYVDPCEPGHRKAPLQVRFPALLWEDRDYVKRIAYYTSLNFNSTQKKRKENIRFCKFDVLAPPRDGNPFLTTSFRSDKWDFRNRLIFVLSMLRGNVNVRGRLFETEILKEATATYKLGRYGRI